MLGRHTAPPRGFPGCSALLGPPVRHHVSGMDSRTEAESAPWIPLSIMWMPVREFDWLTPWWLELTWLYEKGKGLELGQREEALRVGRGMGR